MKYIIYALVSQFIFLSAFAATYTTQVHSVDRGKAGERHLIMLSNGYTAFLKGHDKSLIEAVEESQKNEDTVEIFIDDELNLISIQTVVPEREEPRDDALPGGMISYDPSIINDSAARSAFSNMRRDYQNQSQCYNRAHIWNYEEFNRSGLKSNKLYLFFTSRYIRKYNYKWWFHVTPMVYVDGSDQSNWRTLDRRYTKGTLTTRTWTNVFMLNNAFCPVVYKYSSYRYHQQEEDCFLIPTSMYFWQPRDIDREERTGYVKNQFYRSEVSHAYWEAF